MIWFTSDLHFFHDRILEFHPKRKELFGNTVEKAKEAMIQFIYTLFIIVFVANTIAGIKVQDMDIASLLCTIVCGTILSLEIFFNLKR